jgi:tetrahydromethanopterin S-methyltransferase subunit G
MLYETRADALERDPELDEEALARLDEIDRQLAGEIEEHGEQVSENARLMARMMRRLDEIKLAVDANTAEIGQLKYERDMLKASMKGAQWVLVTVVMGALYFARDILEFVGLISEQK